MTIHRQENTDDLDKLTSIFEGLESISKEMQVVLPIHPRTKKILEKNQLKFDITMIDPVGYFDMLELLKNCQMVVTDSGGLQKEAFFNHKHCIIAREETEWLELVENGFAEVIGSNKDKMIQSYMAFKDKTANFDINLYGDQIGVRIYNEINNARIRRISKIFFSAF